MQEMSYADRVSFERPDPAALRERGMVCADMHFHTRCSDSFTSPWSALKLARRRGVGFAVTDHNLVSSAVELCREKEVDDVVIPGMEISAWDGPHILAYFYDWRDLESYWSRHVRPYRSGNPWLAIRRGTREILESLEGEGCVVSAAHPMGYPSGNKGIEKCISKGILADGTCDLLDAYEVICSGMTRRSNLAALANAERHGLGITGGTDGHLGSELGHVVTAACADDADGLLDAVASGETIVIGREKSLPWKVAMGGVCTLRFLPHTPSALRVHLSQNITGRFRRGL